MRWPLMWRRDADKLRTENAVLRDALHEATIELRRHRLLVADLTAQRARSWSVVDQMIKEKT